MNRRRGFTIIETALALTILAMASVMVAQMATWSLAERAKVEARLAVTEWTANVLETARGRDWTELTPDWAAAQKLPDDLAARLPAIAVAIKVAAEPDRPLLKRVSVEVRWKNPDGTPTPPVTMTGLFAAREKRGAP